MSGIRGLEFETRDAPSSSDPNRVDIALFVGLCDARGAPLDDERSAWLRQWCVTIGRPHAIENEHIDLTLLDVPIPIDSWHVFDEFYAWDQRTLSEGIVGATYLGAAVRSFFAQGGRRCYVVAAGSPKPLARVVVDRMKDLRAILPLYDGAGNLTPDPADPTTWKGGGCVYGLPDVTFVCAPDLVDLCAPTGLPRAHVTVRWAATEVFTVCSSEPPPAKPDSLAKDLPAPRVRLIPSPLTTPPPGTPPDGWALWVKEIQNWLAIVERCRHEALMIAGIPLPDEDDVPDTLPDGTLVHPAQDPAAFFRAPDQRYVIDYDQIPHPDVAGALQSRFLQLAFPWVRTPLSPQLPDDLEPPDGTLVGLLARNALTRGTYSHAAAVPPIAVRDLHPQLHRGAEDALSEFTCVIGEAPTGPALISDVTTSQDPYYQPGGVTRLVAALLRAARVLGEDLVFDPSNERLWRTIEDSLKRLLLGLWRAGALRGATADDAFSVRCDRSTMSADDIDNGRVIAEVSFAPSVGIDTIEVVLAMSDGGVEMRVGAAA